MSLQLGSQLGSHNASSPRARANCAQCGRELPYVPFPLTNITCKDCYGLDRYNKGGRHTSAAAAKKAMKKATKSSKAAAATATSS